MNSFARTIGLSLLNAFLPSRCRHCSARQHLPGPLCLRCFRLLETCRIPLEELPGQTAGGRQVVAASYYRGGSPLRAVHRAAKYDQSDECARWLARYLAKRLMEDELRYGWTAMGAVDVCVPVPSHPARLLDRGLDVARTLAEVAADQLGGIFRADMLTRVRLGTPQNELDREHRLANVESVFAAPPHTGRPQRILLVDDVVTTGATLDACAGLLERQGHHVFLAALAFRRELFGLPGAAAEPGTAQR